MGGNRAALNLRKDWYGKRMDHMGIPAWILAAFFIALIVETTARARGTPDSALRGGFGPRRAARHRRHRGHWRDGAVGAWR
jgi:hypothetical protein